jgi:hypothetical protein
MKAFWNPVQAAHAPMVSLGFDASRDEPLSFLAALG